MPEVERARVHLAIPERRLFTTEQDRARASVVVSLRANQNLSKAQIQGIVHLVSSSVEGLQARDVTVVDGHGNLLSNSSTDESTGLSGTQMEFQRTLEKDIETRIQTMLERIVGVNKAVVRVERTGFQESRDHRGAIRPERSSCPERTTRPGKIGGVNGTSGGVPGVESNVPAARRPRVDRAVRTAIKQKRDGGITRSVARCPASWSRPEPLRNCRWRYW